jgi:hypothetical protein
MFSISQSKIPLPQWSVKAEQSLPFRGVAKWLGVQVLAAPGFRRFKE